MSQYIKPELKTRNVFLDTQVFDAETFYVGTRKLAQLRELAAHGKIHLVTTEVTIDECKNRILKLVNEARNLMSANKRQFNVLRNASALNFAFSNDWKPDEATREIAEKFDAFLKDAKVTVCPLAGVSIETLFSNYFH